MIGQYASFARAVVGQLHLNGFLFSCILIDKKQTELLFLFAKTFKLDDYFFSDFVIVLINWELDFVSVIILVINKLDSHFAVV